MVLHENTPHLDPLGFEAWKAMHPVQAKANFDEAEALSRAAEERQSTKAASKGSPVWLGMGEAPVLDPIVPDDNYTSPPHCLRIASLEMLLCRPHCLT